MIADTYPPIWTLLVYSGGLPGSLAAAVGSAADVRARSARWARD